MTRTPSSWRSLGATRTHWSNAGPSVNGVDVIRQAFREVQEAVEGDVASMQPAELFFQPAPEANHAGFLLWHLVRDEDAVVSDITGQTNLWASGRWFERLGMAERGQGTDFDAESLSEFRYDLDEFMVYARAVWRDSVCPRTAGPDGVAHAEMALGDGRVLMGSPGGDYRNPKHLGGSTHQVYVYVNDIDAHFARAEAAGADIIEPVEEQFYGDKCYGAADPEGHVWYFAEHVRDVSKEEMQAAAKEMAGAAAD